MNVADQLHRYVMDHSRLNDSDHRRPLHVPTNKLCTFFWCISLFVVFISQWYIYLYCCAIYMSNMCLFISSIFPPYYFWFGPKNNIFYIMSYNISFFTLNVRGLVDNDRRSFFFFSPNMAARTLCSEGVRCGQGLLCGFLDKKRPRFAPPAALFFLSLACSTGEN